MKPFTSLNRFAGAAPVVVRVVVGVVMATHGWGKVTGPGPAGVGQGLAELGLPLASVLGYLLAYGELLGGIALIIGLLTRVASLGLSLVLIGAIFLVKVNIGFVSREATGFELELALLAGLVTLMLLGPGRPSLDHALGLEGSARASRRREKVPA